MKKVSEYKEFELSRDQFFQIIALSNGIWPHPNKTGNDLVTEAFDFAQKNPDPWIRRFVIWEKDQAVAHARVFPRKIITAKGELRIMALASVCVLEEKRGEGYGRLIVERVFRLLDESEFPLTLFQTGVPGFYRKLGAKNISNTFYNSQNLSNPASNPWWEKIIMIYPGSYDFPQGKIDLNGFGY
jgi:predicted N-acetyltransferase YhbS